ncbi:hypothetical protein BGX26_010825 [Mortierella sp. AD094]|nr:hypothetical protein BGX26_010825 [Mortierella sp. AD094]
MGWHLFSSPSGLSLEDALDVAREHLEDARKEIKSPGKALLYCKHAKEMIYDAERSYDRKKVGHQNHHDEIAKAYHEHAELLDELGVHDKAKKSHQKAQKFGYMPLVVKQTGTPQQSRVSASSVQTGSSRTATVNSSAQSNSCPAASPARASISAATFQPEPQAAPVQALTQNEIKKDVPEATKKDAPEAVKKPVPEASKAKQPPVEQVDTMVPLGFFHQNVRPPIAEFSFPEPGARITTTPQLAYCLSILSTNLVSEKADEKAIADDRAKANAIDEDERARLIAMSTDLVIQFLRDELKKPEVVAEVVSLAAVLSKDDSRELLQAFVDGINKSVLLEVHLLNGLAQFMMNTPSGYFDSDDLVKILQLLNNRLAGTHTQSSKHMYQLAVTVSRVLDGMVDIQVEGLEREKLHEPLGAYMNGLKKHSDPSMVFEAVYAFQALQYVPDDESVLQKWLRRSGKVVKGISGVVTAVKALDVNGFIGGLKDLQSGLDGIIAAGKIGYEAYKQGKEVYESGVSLYEALKEGLSFDQRSAWYPALRGLDNLIQEGRLVDFEKLIREAPCRRDPAFQWGVSQRLGEIASNGIWPDDVRLNALSFLVEIYRDDAEWGHHASVKQWTLHIINSLESSENAAVTEEAKKQLKELEKNIADKEALIQKYEKDHTSPYPFMVSHPPKASPLLDRVQKVLDLEQPLRQLRMARAKEQLEGGDNTYVYISPLAKTGRATGEFDLDETVDKFLASEKKVFLLLGDSGAGKSTFNRALEAKLWKNYKRCDRIPLFIHLPSIDKPEQDLVAKHLKDKCNFTEAQIREMKTYRTFILICDGFDECQLTRNLYTSNQWNQPGEWKVQLIISCRTDYNGSDYKDVFRPTDRNNGGKADLFQEATIVPFNKSQIDDYVRLFAKASKNSWEAETYLKALKDIQGLDDLVKNPFLLKLTMDVLPSLLKEADNPSLKKITRVELYDEFIKQWLDRSKNKLQNSSMSQRDRDDFKTLTSSVFELSGKGFLKDLSAAIYDNQGGNPVVSYNSIKDKKTWKENFFLSTGPKKLLRSAIPLVSSNTQFRFIHRSVLEYGLALSIFDPTAETDTVEPDQVPSKQSLSRRGSDSSILSFEEEKKVEKETVAIEQSLLDSYMGRKWIVHEPSILQFLVERAVKFPYFQERLRAAIERSKTDKKLARFAAANAITILVRAGVQFNGEDLRGINIPGANLSFGVFDSACLEKADLRKVNLRNVWLRNANLSEALMTGAQFGESPYLQENHKVTRSAYSPEGDTYAVGLENGHVNLYETTGWRKLHTLGDHSKEITCLAYSTTGDRIVTGSGDGTLRLWDVKTGGSIHVLKGHEEGVNSVSYSPEGDRIASGGQDGTVRLWDANTGKCIHVLEGHREPINIVVYSPKGDQVASGSDGNTVILWNAESGSLLHTLEGHSAKITSVVYTFEGDRIASGSSDKTVRLWDTATGQFIRLFEGHVGEVTKVAFSRNGEQLASGGTEKELLLWNVGTGVCDHTLKHTDKVTDLMYSPEGGQLASGTSDSLVNVWDVNGEKIDTFEVNNEAINSVVYSPKGKMLTAGCAGKTVRLWDIEAQNYFHSFVAHADDVNDVAYFKNGEEEEIVTAGDDTDLRLWDVKTGKCTKILSGHKGKVNSVVISPNRNQLASTSDDKTVRLWNATTDKTLCLECELEPRDSKPAVGVAYSPSGDRIATGFGNNAARLWNTKTGEVVHTLEGHTLVVTIIAYSPEGNLIATGGEDMTVKLWDAETGKCVHTLKGHTGAVTSIMYSQKGGHIASGSEDKTVRLWKVETGEVVHVLEGHTDSVTSVVYSPKGGRIASGSDDKTVRLWDVETGNHVRTLEGHESKIGRVVYSPKGDRIATGGQDYDWTVRIWCASEGQCQVVIGGFNAKLNGIAWKEDGKDLFLATTSDDKSLRRWKITKDGSNHNATLCWSSSHEVLTVSDASFSNAQGLSRMQNMLLSQRKATVTPTTPLE